MLLFRDWGARLRVYGWFSHDHAITAACHLCDCSPTLRSSMACVNGVLYILTSASLPGATAVSCEHLGTLGTVSLDAIGGMQRRDLPPPPSLLQTPGIEDEVDEAALQQCRLALQQHGMSEIQLAMTLVQRTGQPIHSVQVMFDTMLEMEGQYCCSCGAAPMDDTCPSCGVATVEGHALASLLRASGITEDTSADQLQRVIGSGLTPGSTSIPSHLRTNATDGTLCDPGVPCGALTTSGDFVVALTVADIHVDKANSASAEVSTAAAATAAAAAAAAAAARPVAPAKKPRAFPSMFGAPRRVESSDSSSDSDAPFPFGTVSDRTDTAAGGSGAADAPTTVVKSGTLTLHVTRPADALTLAPVHHTTLVRAPRSGMVLQVPHAPVKPVVRSYGHSVGDDDSALPQSGVLLSPLPDGVTDVTFELWARLYADASTQTSRFGARGRGWAAPVKLESWNLCIPVDAFDYVGQCLAHVCVCVCACCDTDCDTVAKHGYPHRCPAQATAQALGKPARSPPRR